MELEELEGLEPVSPNGQYFSSDALSLSILAVLESEIPMDLESQSIFLLKTVFLPISPRFSSIMVCSPSSLCDIIAPSTLFVKQKTKNWLKTQIYDNIFVQLPHRGYAFFLFLFFIFTGIIFSRYYSNVLIMTSLVIMFGFQGKFGIAVFLLKKVAYDVFWK